MFYKKTTKIDEIFTVDLTLMYILHYVKSTVKISSVFVAFLENMNFTSALPAISLIMQSWSFSFNASCRHPAKKKDVSSHAATE